MTLDDEGLDILYISVSRRYSHVKGWSSERSLSSFRYLRVSHWHQSSSQVNKADDSNTRRRLSQREADVIFGSFESLSLAAVYLDMGKVAGISTCDGYVPTRVGYRRCRYSTLTLIFTAPKIIWIPADVPITRGNTIRLRLSKQVYCQRESLIYAG